MYGSYYDVLPIAYGSAGALHPVTSTYNRFPVEAEDLDADRFLIAVNVEPTDIWGEESRDRVQEDCLQDDILSSADTVYSRIGIYDCPASVLLEPMNPRQD